MFWVLNIFTSTLTCLFLLYCSFVAAEECEFKVMFEGPYQKGTCTCDAKAAPHMSQPLKGYDLYFLQEWKAVILFCNKARLMLFFFCRVKHHAIR